MGVGRAVAPSGVLRGRLPPLAVLLPAVHVSVRADQVQPVRRVSAVARGASCGCAGCAAEHFDGVVESGGELVVICHVSTPERVLWWI